MSADYRLFIKVHNGFPEHRKTVELSDRAFRRLVEAWCYCSRNLNDGHLTKRQLSQLFSQKVCVELVAAGYVQLTESGAEMRNYLDHQISAAQVADLRLKRATAGQRGGRAKANHLASAIAKAKQTPSKPLADLELDLEVEENSKNSSSPATPMRPSDFDRFWEIYPRKVAKIAAEKAFVKAVKTAGLPKIAAGVRRFAADPNLPADRNLIPHASTWLTEGRWDDEPYSARSETNGHVRAVPTFYPARNGQMAREM